MPSPETPGFSIKIEAEQSAPRVVVTGDPDNDPEGLQIDQQATDSRRAEMAAAAKD